QKEGIKMRVGFIGTGRIANRHLEKLIRIKNVELISFCDLIKERAEEVAKKYGGRAYTDHYKMLDKENLDAVYICLPPFAHTNQEILAAEKGINLFIEKPIALNLEKARQINEVIKKAGIISSVGYVYRYSDIVNRVKEEVGDKKIALLLGYYLSSMPHPSWWRKKDASGGQIVEQATHIFDLARYFAGEVDKLYAQRSQGLMSNIENYSVDDASCVSLHFRNGTIGTISSTCLLQRKGRWGINLIGKDIEINLFLSSHFLRINGEEEGEKIRAARDPYQEENQAFIEAVKNNDPTPIKSPYSDALKTLELTLAANTSLEKGRAVIL
ncbi:MAG: Gfo/Idh/MocA family oxidoreductase, partial [Candidatus Aerophobetes bacterium]|nr:Gfo/Idh/MocA family oxidoreductase [Candidatus Aerophobetes bacterium]